MTLRREQDAADPGITDPTLGRTRQQELAGFLRARRADLSPQAAGLPERARRRVRGLRREEVAEAAGISVDWYTWMEQAREVNLSAATLHSLARALRLDAQQAAHLFRLAGHAAPAQEPVDLAGAMEQVRRVIDSLQPHPAYALDSRWNVVAWNAAAEELFRFEALRPEERNMVSLTFGSARHRALFENWPDVARCTLAHFRTDSVQHVEDAAWRQQIDTLSRESEVFRGWWQQHDVTWPYSSRKVVLHPTLGRRIYQTLDMEVRQPAPLRIVTYTPAEESTVFSKTAEVLTSV